MITKALQQEVYNCIKCGLCMTPCPVYKQLYFEAAAPRGKVQLIRNILEGKLEPSENFQRLLFTCLLCETCTVNCPSGLKVDRLLKAMRAEIIKTFGLPWQKKMLFHLLTSNRLLPFFLFWGRALGNPLLNLLPKKGKLGTIPYPRLPRLNGKPLRDQYPAKITVENPKGRVLYFTGCATNYLFENVGHSLLRVLKHLGVEVLIPKEQVCCGLPVFLSGARDMALNNIRKNLKLFNPKDVDAVIVDCATCGAALKTEYAHILEEMGEDIADAEALAGKVQDISQYLARFDLGNLPKSLQARVTYHDPCHLLRSQGVKEEPRALLKRIPGVDYVEMAGADVCCGGGGTFQWDHPEVAVGITAQKIRAIQETRATMVASGCPGCRLQIYGNLGDAPIQVVHPIELLGKCLE
ncbi:MAG: (Fe-S)-binding protein [Deltaproteobacteria bacterium]|nr:(Fe-S)-binding protein [Deltaproteobacteria bacterium]